MTVQVANGVVKTIRVGRGVSIQLDNNAWYGAGFDAAKLTFVEGNTIQFTLTEKGAYKNIDLKSVEITEASTATSNMTPAPSTPAAVKTNVSVGRDDYWKKKEDEDKVKSKEIRYLACLSRATATVDLLISQGALSLGSTAKKKVEVVDGAIEAYTQKYYNASADARNGGLDGNATAEIEPVYE